MVIRADVLAAFDSLGISPDIDQSTATKAYKKLALLHHPDRNHGDQSATQRFQEIGAAWDICQRHYDNPAWSHRQDPYPGFSCDDDDDLDDEDLHAFYMYMFAETLFGRYTRANGRRYRAGFHRSPYPFSSYSSGYSSSPERRANNAEKQRRKEKEEYEERKRELELEIEQEERERERLAKSMKATEDRRASAMENAFLAAAAGDSEAVQKAVLEYNLDVNAPKKRGKQSRKQGDPVQHETLLHVAACHCDETLVMFLIEKGANPQLLNKEQLTPFHAAISAGNISVVRFIMERRGRSFEGYHPSKAAASGHTPLQLAIGSGIPAMVELLIKDATTHDVERCWKQESLSKEIREILRTKKGFIPPEELVAPDPVPQGTSKKSQRKQELAQQKEARLAEEHERAAINRQKKEERAAKRIEREREEAAQKKAAHEAQLKAEEDERLRLMAARRLQEQEAREQAKREAQLKAEQDARDKELRIKAEAEAREKARLKADAARRKAEENRRIQREKEALVKKAEEAAHLQAAREAEEKATREAEEKAAREAEEKATREAQEKAAREAQEKAAREAKEKAARETKEKAAREAKEKAAREAKEKFAQEAKEKVAREAREKIAREAAKREKLVQEQTRLCEESTTTSVPTLLTTAKPNKKKGYLSPEEFALKKAKLKEKRKAKIMQEKTKAAEPTLDNTTPSTSTPVAPKSYLKKAKSKKAVGVDVESMDEQQKEEYEATLRRRAEQSARDKERNRRLREERAQAAAARPQSTAVTSEYVPLTPVSTHTTAYFDVHENNTFQSPSSPHVRVPHAPLEDIQTCTVPDDLFREDKLVQPPAHREESFSQTSEPFQPTQTTSPQIVVPRAVRRPYRFYNRRRVPNA